MPLLSRGKVRSAATYVYNEWVSHIPSRRVRRYVLRRLLAECGPGASVLMHVCLMNPPGIHIGEGSAVNQHCILDGRGYSLHIGSDVDIGTHTHIWTLQHDPQSPTHGSIGGAVMIEDHVWIASRVTVLPGVTIGQGAVVATCAVVTKDVSPLTIVAGNPARPIGRVEYTPTYRLNFNPIVW